jgi:tetratricopeptide (TPR) repeat protein/transcriptional regulator with XRE-family HTH domain
VGSGVGPAEGIGPVVDGPAAEQDALGFGGLLRRLRDEAGLTQDELAGAAGVSQRAISDLERGINATARKDTAVLLAGALGLDGTARELFVAAARGRAPAGDVLAASVGANGAGGLAAAASQTLPRDIASFTGRQAELGQLVARWGEAAASGAVVSIHAIGGMAGIGKTTFAVHAAHRLAGRFPDGQFFLPLHAHTPGQRPVTPADGLASLLLTAGVPAHQIPPGVDARAGRWRNHLAGKKILLVLDDAAGHEQVRPLLPGSPGSLVLKTSRRRLAALEDAAVISLDTLTPDEAARLLARLADRPDVTAGDAAVGELAALCGYLPLAIGMTGRQLGYHPAWTPAGLAADLAAAKDRLALMVAENLSVAAAFGLSYQDLDDGQRRLFRRLGLHPGADIDACAAAALDDTTLDQARRGLEVLYDQHLITQPAHGRYRFHDLLRQHARALAATGDPAESDAAAVRLLDYYLHTALAANEHIANSSWNLVVNTLPSARPPACAPSVSTPRQAAAWLEDERANLHAAAGYAAVTGQPLHAMLIPAAMADFLEARGYWDQGLAMHESALAAARRAGDLPGQARALVLLANLQVLTSDLASAAATFQQARGVYHDLGDRAGQADAVNGLGFTHSWTSRFDSAIACHQQALELFRDLGHRRGQAEALSGLGSVYLLTGNYPAATASHQQALELFRDSRHRHGQAAALSALGTVQRLTGDYPAAVATLRQAMVLSHDLDDGYKQAWVLAELGVVQRLTGDHRSAAVMHREALEKFRDLGDRLSEAYTLNQLGLVQQLTGDYPAAAASHQQALQLYRDLGHLHEQPEVLNSLGELSSRTAASHQARDHHNQALAIARELGLPLEEARALEGIGQSHIQEGNPEEGAAQLRQALTIYQHIRAPDARRIHEILKGHSTR